MKKLLGAGLLLSLGLCAQTPPVLPNVPPDTVVATVDGRKVTAEEVAGLLRTVPEQAQQNFFRDPRGFLGQWGMMNRLAGLALAEKLDQKSPFKEQLELQRLVILYNAKANDQLNHTLVTAEDQKKFYEANRERYLQVKVKAIYLAFTSNPAATAGASGKKFLTEAEAKAKAEKLLAEIRGGADFVKLAKEHSDDIASREKDGDFATISRADKIPEDIKRAVFALKTGETSEPIRQPNGYYLFRATDSGLKSFDLVRDEIFIEIQQARWKRWFEETQKSIPVKIEKEDFFRGNSTTQVPNPLGPVSPQAK